MIKSNPNAICCSCIKKHDTRIHIYDAKQNNINGVYKWEKKKKKKKKKKETGSYWNACYLKERERKKFNISI